MLLGAGLSFAGAAEAANYSVSTTGKSFEPMSLNITVGDIVTFVTKDYLGQAIYSLSPAKVFSLSNRTFSESETVRFNEPGTVKVRAAGQIGSTELTINIRSGG
jgi:plastocyanin